VLRVVSFDVGETLIDSYYLGYVWNTVIPQLYAKKKGLDFEGAKDYVLKEYDLVGVNDIRWYLPEFWFEHFSLDEDPLEVFRSNADKIRFYHEVPLVLENLSLKYDLIAASGIPKNIVEIIIEDFRHYFKHVFSSVSDLEEAKKTPRFYRMVCKDSGIKPSALVHVGNDWKSDFVIPRKIGIKCFLLDRTEEKSGKFVIRDLRELEGRLKNLSKTPPQLDRVTKCLC
jgi:FMN phosphatase YigB (HAD superfamily)